MKRTNAERRGRKPGILKLLDNPLLHPAQKAVMLAYDGTAGNPASKLVRTFRNILGFSKSLIEWEARIGEARIAAAADDEVRQYLAEKQRLASWVDRARSELFQKSLQAVTMDRRALRVPEKENWFTRMGKAIEAEGNDQDPYPRHTALISIFYPGLEIHRNSILSEELYLFPDRDGRLGALKVNEKWPAPKKLTISEICALLKAKGLEPENQKDRPEGIEGWKRTIREDCAMLGIKLARSKPGRKKS